MNGSPAAATPWQRAAIGALAAALLALGIAQTAWPWLVDDAFISLRFADRLVAGHGLTWTDGERVEGYSNLLWVLLTALLRALGVDGMTAVRGLGFACALATIAVLVGGRLLPPSAPALLAVAIATSLATFATWTTGGLEAMLVVLLLALAASWLVRAFEGERVRRRSLFAAGTALAFAAWTRLDAPLWVVPAAAFVLLHPGAGARRAGTRLRDVGCVVAPPLVAVLAQTAFRLAYYGEWLPNTAVAKVAISAASLAAGCDHALANAGAMRALLLPAALGLLGLGGARTRPVVAFAAAGAVLWWAHVIVVGGDAFPRGRLLVPSLLPLTVLAAHGLGWLAARGRIGRAAAWLVALGCIALGGRDARAADADPSQRLSTWEWYGKAAGQWLHRAFADRQPLLAVDAAGAVPYFSGLPCLDMLGLCDRTIARTPLSPEQGFVPGHARANGRYVLSRRPDLVMFGTPPGSPQPQWLGGRQMEADAGFLADHRLFVADLGTSVLDDGSAVPLHLVAWARLDGRLGPRAAPGEPGNVVVPGFWLDSYRQPYSFLQAAAHPERVDPARLVQDVQAGAAWLRAPRAVVVSGRDGTGAVAEVRARGRLAIDDLPLPPGRWRVRADTVPAGVLLSLTAADGAPLPAADGAFEVAGSGGSTAVDLVCIVPDATPVPFHVTHFVLERRP